MFRENTRQLSPDRARLSIGDWINIKIDEHSGHFSAINHSLDEFGRSRSERSKKKRSANDSRTERSGIDMLWFPNPVSQLSLERRLSIEIREAFHSERIRGNQSWKQGNFLRRQTVDRHDFVGIPKRTRDTLRRSIDPPCLFARSNFEFQHCNPRKIPSSYVFASRSFWVAASFSNKEMRETMSPGTLCSFCVTSVMPVYTKIPPDRYANSTGYGLSSEWQMRKCHAKPNRRSTSDDKWGVLAFAASRTTTPGNGCEVSRGKVSLMQCHRTSDRCFASSEHLEDRRVKKYGDRRMESRLYSTIERKEKTIGWSGATSEVDERSCKSRESLFFHTIRCRKKADRTLRSRNARKDKKEKETEYDGRRRGKTSDRFPF